MRDVNNEDKNRNRRILIIDDNEAIQKDFQTILGQADTNTSTLDKAKNDIFEKEADTIQQYFEVDSAFQGQEGLEKIMQAEKEGRPYIMAFVDVRMPPGWDGIETIKRIWEKKPDLQIIICTAYSDYSWHDMINELGQTDRLLILKKPFDNIEVRQLACALCEKWELLNNLDQLVQQRTMQITKTRDVAVFALAQLTESRDPETGEHLERIRKYCQILAEQLRDDSCYSNQIDKLFIKDLYRSSPLHDIGKVGIPDKILLKPGSLTNQEFEIMKEHSAIGADALSRTMKHTSSAGFLKMAVEIARHHHEHFDGTGYPDNLEAEQIPLSARIAALADVYDALTSARVYKPAFKAEIARLMIEEERYKHFDPVIVDAFMNRQDDFLSISRATANSHSDMQNNVPVASSL